MRRQSEVWVGAVVLAGLALVVGGTLWLSGAQFGREQVTVEARFREVGQLMVGNAVKVRGVPIGRVEEIVLEPGGDAVIVRMRIQRDVALPRDPVVLLAPESMFGDWQAEIHPRALFPDFDYAEPLDPKVLPGYSLPDLSRLTAVADRIAHNLAILTERFELAFTEETARNVREAVENIQQASEQITRIFSRQQRTMDELAADLGAATETLGRAAEAIQRTSGHVEAALAGGRLGVIVGNVERATAQLDSFATALSVASRDLRVVVARADSALQVMGGSARGRGTLGRLLQDTTLYADLVRTNALLQRLLADIQANPRKYINLKIF